MSTENYTFSDIFSKRVAELMREKNVTQIQVADACHVTQATVHRWLNGTMPGAAELYHLALFFDVPMEFFFKGGPAFNLSARKEISPEEMDAMRPADVRLDEIQIFLSHTKMSWDDFKNILEFAEKMRSAGAHGTEVAGHVAMNETPGPPPPGKPISYRGKKSSATTAEEVADKQVKEHFSRRHRPKS